MRTWAGWLALGLAAVLSAESTSYGYFLDKGRNFDVRLRAYSQLGILTNSADRSGCPDPTLCPPAYTAGDLAQHRNFYNPEFDAKLTDYTRWMGNVPGLSVVAPDEFKFRFAWWGFYDGLYDYLDPRWDENRRNLNARFAQSDNPARESFIFNDENKNPRHIYASRNRINELYMDYTKGPAFFRIGRQAISWGESDSIALLDVQNPFDITLGAPGFFQDVDEARIPLWTFRSTVKLLDNWRWLSSLFGDAYLVPGPIDTTVPINPITGGVSPFGPDVGDPQAQVAGVTVPGLPGQKVPTTLHINTVDRLPNNDWGNSRWGARLTGVLFRDYTVQTWFFRTFNQAPQPILASPGAVQLAFDGKLQPTQIDNRGFRTPVCNNIDPVTGFGRTPAGRRCTNALPIVTVLDRRLESVVGVAATWFSQPVNGIIRAEAEYFIDELAFIPDKNLNARAQLPKQVLAAFNQKPVRTSMPTADYLRFVLGYDRFFFFRPMNPSNSFVLSMAFNGSINISEDSEHDYRNATSKPGKGQAVVGPVPGIPQCNNPSSLGPLAQACVSTPAKNFEDQYKFEGFLQTALQTDYLHGKLTPRLVIITDISGIFAFAPTATYRFTDSLLGSFTWLTIEGARKAGLGTFREHDMIQLRLTYQLN